MCRSFSTAMHYRGNFCTELYDFPVICGVGIRMAFSFSFFVWYEVCLVCNLLLISFVVVVVVCMGGGLLCDFMGNELRVLSTVMAGVCGCVVVGFSSFSFGLFFFFQFSISLNFLLLIYFLVCLFPFFFIHCAFIF